MRKIIFSYLSIKGCSFFLYQNNILAKEQVDFIRGNRTSDNLTILHGLIYQNFKKSKKLYACFIDFEKAFDAVPRYLQVGETENCGVLKERVENISRTEVARDLKIG